MERWARRSSPSSQSSTLCVLTLLLLVSCPLSRVRLLDRLDCGPPGSSVLGILQARTLEGLPFPPPSSVGRVPHQVLQVPFLLLTAPYPLPWQDADSSERIIAPMRWGLVPYWFREADLSKLQINTSNCRSDNIMEKRSFKVGAARAHCGALGPCGQPQAVPRAPLDPGEAERVSPGPRHLFLPLERGLPATQPEVLMKRSRRRTAGRPGGF